MVLVVPRWARAMHTQLIHSQARDPFFGGGWRCPMPIRPHRKPLSHVVCVEAENTRPFCGNFQFKRLCNGPTLLLKATAPGPKNPFSKRKWALAGVLQSQFSHSPEYHTSRMSPAETEENSHFTNPNPISEKLIQQTWAFLLPVAKLQQVCVF